MDRQQAAHANPAEQVGPIDRVREGMTVMDRDGEKVGTVEDVRMGDPGAVTEAGNQREHPDFLGTIADVFTGEEHEPDVPNPLRARLLRSGYLKIDGGFLVGKDRYVPADMIASVNEDVVRLHARKDELFQKE